MTSKVWQLWLQACSVYQRKMVYHLPHQMLKLLFSWSWEGGNIVQRWSLHFPLSLSMINGTICLEGVVTGRGKKPWKWLCYYTQVRLSCRGKISWPRVYTAGAVSRSHLLLSFPHMTDEFTPGVAEMVSGRAGIIIQAKALWLYLGWKRWGSCGRWPCWQGPAVYEGQGRPQRLFQFACSSPRVWLTAVPTLRSALVGVFTLSWADLGFRRNACF